MSCDGISPASRRIAARPALCGSSHDVPFAPCHSFLAAFHRPSNQTFRSGCFENNRPQAHGSDAATEAVVCMPSTTSPDFSKWTAYAVHRAHWAQGLGCEVSKRVRLMDGSVNWARDPGSFL